MMKKTNKKRGFTIIELTIVVAVIAILSAVLIPTFAGIIKKSRESADEQAVRNMNTALGAAVLEDDATIYDVYGALSENGIDADNYKPLYKDRFFFYDSASQQIIYTDAAYEVLYPAHLAGVSTEANRLNWTSLSGEIKKADVKQDVEIKTESVTINGTAASKVVAEVESAAEFVAVMDAISNGQKTTEEVEVIKLTNDVNLMGANFNFGEVAGDIAMVADEEVEIKGFRTDEFLMKSVNPTAGLTEYGHGLFPKIPAGKTVTVENVKFVNAVVGDTESTSKNSQFGFVAGVVEGTLIVNNVSFENCVINGCQKVGVVAGQVQGNGVVTLTNVTATNCQVTGAAQAARAIGFINGNGSATATNCNFSGVTVSIATGETWTSLWSTNGVADKNWNGTDLSTSDTYTHNGAVYAKYLNGTSKQLWAVYANVDYWKKAESQSITTDGVETAIGEFATNFSGT